MERVVQLCENQGVLQQVQLGGSRNRQISTIRKQLAKEFVEEPGMSYAGAVRLLGISASGIFVKSKDDNSGSEKIGILLLRRFPSLHIARIFRKIQMHSDSEIRSRSPDVADCKNER